MTGTAGNDEVTAGAGTAKGSGPDGHELRVSTREPSELGPALERWLGARLGAGARPRVTGIETTGSNGMSSDTVLFDAAWDDAGARRAERLVARIAPPGDAVPVFPHYDLGRQYETMRLVRELTSVPVPGVRWSESDPTALGAPFFVMERVDGVVPPDVLPYPFGDNWLYDATPEQQQRLQDRTVEVVAALATVEDPERRFAFLEADAPGDTPLRRHVARTRAWYEFASAGSYRSALVEHGFRWLEDHWPAHEGPTVLSWGDARIGNVVYRDFEPVGVLDWEMAGLGPAELDVAWLVTAHEVFQALAGQFELPGMPSLLRADDVAADYGRRTGHEVRDLTFHRIYAAVQWGIVFLRTGARSVHFGERPAPEEPDELLHHRAYLEGLLGAASRS